jgi:hypothetical protein
MKKFREYITEEMMPYAQTEKGFVGVDNGPVRDNINIHLTSITARPYATPYHALEMVRKVLAPFHIGLPATNFLAGDSGHEVFEINQFGERIGMKNNGDVVTTTGSSYFVYFEYSMNDKGSFDIFSEIVNKEELDELLADVEDEMEEGDEEYYDDDVDASDSYDSYKSDNKINEAKDFKNDYDRNWKYVKMHNAAAKKAGEYIDDKKFDKAKLKVKMMKRISNKIRDPDSVDEDYDLDWAKETKHTKNILSGARRKDDKKKWKSFVKDANKRAVTGMSGKAEGEKREK